MGLGNPGNKNLLAPRVIQLNVCCSPLGGLKERKLFDASALLSIVLLFS